MSLLAEAQKKLELAAKNADAEARYAIFTEALHLYATHHISTGNVLPADMIAAVKDLDAADIRLGGARRRLREARAALAAASDRTSAANACSIRAADQLVKNPSDETKAANNRAFDDAQLARDELGRVCAAFVKTRAEYFEAFNRSMKYAEVCAQFIAAVASQPPQ